MESMESNEKYVMGFLKPQNIPVGRKNRNPGFLGWVLSQHGFQDMRFRFFL